MVGSLENGVATKTLTINIQQFFFHHDKAPTRSVEKLMVLGLQLDRHPSYFSDLALQTTTFLNVKNQPILLFRRDQQAITELDEVYKLERYYVKK